MASVTSSLPSPLLLPNSRKPLLRTLQNFRLSGLKDKPSGLKFLVRATGESSESSTSLSIFKSVQTVWEKPEDRFALIGLGFAGIVALWASANLVTAIDKVPLIPSVLEIIGILFSSWFIYRCLLFKPDREEFFQGINKSVSDILGQ